VLVTKYLRYYFSFRLVYIFKLKQISVLLGTENTVINFAVTKTADISVITLLYCKSIFYKYHNLIFPGITSLEYIHIHQCI